MIDRNFSSKYTNTNTKDDIRFNVNNSSNLIDNTQNSIVSNYHNNYNSNNNNFNMINNISNSNTSNVQNNNLTISMLEPERITAGKEQYEYIKCILCFRIASKNRFFTCCEQIVCEPCTNDWLNKKKNCPNCRTDNPQVTNVSKFVMRLFDDLRFECVYNNQGCKEKNLTITNIDEHEKYCEFNPTGLVSCKDCLTTYEKKEANNHSCIKVLLDINKDLTNQIKNLKISSKDITNSNTLNTNTIFTNNNNNNYSYLKPVVQESKQVIDFKHSLK